MYTYLVSDLKHEFLDRCTLSDPTRFVVVVDWMDLQWIDLHNHCCCWVCDGVCVCTIYPTCDEQVFIPQNENKTASTTQLWRICTME